jgi:ribosomal subunit interface protein
MDIRVSGHQIETGAALQNHVNDRLSAIVEKYFNRALSSHVTFGKAPAGAFSCDIVTHVMHGLILKAHGVAQDAHQALDQAAEKIDKQLRRYKRRLHDRHEQSAFAADQEEAAYTILAAPDADADEVEVADAVMMLDLRDTNAMLFKNAGTGRHNMVYRRRDGSIGWVEPR